MPHQILQEGHWLITFNAFVILFNLYTYISYREWKAVYDGSTIDVPSKNDVVYKKFSADLNSIALKVWFSRIFFLLISTFNLFIYVYCKRY